MLRGPAIVRATGLPRAMSTSKNGPPIATTLNLCWMCTRSPLIICEGVISSLVFSSETRPLMAEMMQVLPRFLAIMGRR